MNWHSSLAIHILVQCDFGINGMPTGSQEVTVYDATRVARTRSWTGAVSEPTAQAISSMLHLGPLSSRALTGSERNWLEVVPA